MTPWDDAIAQWSFDKACLRARAPTRYPVYRTRFCRKKRRENLRTGGGGTGESAPVMIPEQQRLLETFTLLVANALSG